MPEVIRIGELLKVSRRSGRFSYVTAAVLALICGVYLRGKPLPSNYLERIAKIVGCTPDGVYKAINMALHYGEITHRSGTVNGHVTAHVSSCKETYYDPSPQLLAAFRG